jgi:hypothetical protein
MKTVDIKNLTIPELIYLAENMICILDCKANEDDEYETPDELVINNLNKVPVLLDMIGWHEKSETVKKITLENIHDYKNFLSDLEFNCLPYTTNGHEEGIRFDLLDRDNDFKF